MPVTEDHKWLQFPPTSSSNIDCRVNNVTNNVQIDARLSIQYSSCVWPFDEKIRLYEKQFPMLTSVGLGTVAL
jgi:hypothetical protein